MWNSVFIDWCRIIKYFTSPDLFVYFNPAYKCIEPIVYQYTWVGYSDYIYFFDVERSTPFIFSDLTLCQIECSLCKILLFTTLYYR